MAAVDTRAKDQLVGRMIGGHMWKKVSWWILWIVVAVWSAIIGLTAYGELNVPPGISSSIVANSASSAQPNSGSSTSTPSIPVELGILVAKLKNTFFLLAGLAVFMPLYIAVLKYAEDARSGKMNNTFALLSAWENPNVATARATSREHRKEIKNRNDDDSRWNYLQGNTALNSAIHTLFNYFEMAWVAMHNDRVDKRILSQAIGYVYIELHSRYNFWILKSEHPGQYIHALSELKREFDRLAIKYPPDEEQK